MGRKEIDYEEVDVGCRRATEYLGGKQSRCLKCPFKVCVLDDQYHFKHERDREIRKKARDGEQEKELSKKYWISERTIRRILRE